MDGCTYVFVMTVKSSKLTTLSTAKHQVSATETVPVINPFYTNTLYTDHDLTVDGYILLVSGINWEVTTVYHNTILHNIGK